MKLAEHWDRALELAVKAMKNNDIFVYPTDTLYGLGGNALSKDVFMKVNEIKERKAEKPFSVILGNLDMILKYFELDSVQISYITKCLPGPYTFILKPKKAMPVSEGNVGVRVPDNYFIRKVSIDSGLPIITTSANISEEKPPVTVEEIDRKIISGVGLVIDGGPSKHKKPSTVVDLVEKKIIRYGAGTFEF